MSLRYGVDLSRHRSQVISAEDVESADLIVLMDRRNWIALRRIGAGLNKLLWLGALTPGDIEIKDPYDTDDATAEKIVRRMLECSDVLASRLGA